MFGYVCKETAKKFEDKHALCIAGKCTFDLLGCVFILYTVVKYTHPYLYLQTITYGQSGCEMWSISDYQVSNQSFSYTLQNYLKNPKFSQPESTHIICTFSFELSRQSILDLFIFVLYES